MTYEPALCGECQERLITVEEEADARTRTVDDLFKEGMNTLIDVARQNNLTEDDIDGVLRAIIDDRADEVRSTFKIH